MRIVTSLNKEIAQSIEDNSYFAPLFQSILFVASDSIPVIAQLLTMVFGLIRAEQDRNQLKSNSGYLNLKGNKSDSMLSRTSINSQFFDPPLENYNSNTHRKLEINNRFY